MAARRGFFNGCMDWATQLVRALLDWAASRRLPAGLSAKLVKGALAARWIPCIPVYGFVGMRWERRCPLLGCTEPGRGEGCAAATHQLAEQSCYCGAALGEPLIKLAAGSFLTRCPLRCCACCAAELRASVQRKAAQYQFLYRGARVFLTSLLSEATHYMADYIVTVSLEVYMALAARGRKGAEAGTQRVRRLAARAGLHALRCATLLVTVSAGGWWR